MTYVHVVSRHPTGWQQVSELEPGPAGLLPRTGRDTQGRVRQVPQCFNVLRVDVKSSSQEWDE